MNFFVNRNSLVPVIEKLNKKDLLVFDCETTGLHAYHNSEMFSVAISDGTDNYYFNFQNYPGLDVGYVLEKWMLTELVLRPRTWIAHNAKFDLHFMDKAILKPNGPVIDTNVMATIFNNNYKYSGGYSLDACAKRWLGEEKDDRVKKWMDDNNAFTTKSTEDGRTDKHYFFNVVPVEIISEYAMKDAELTFKLYNFLKDNMYENKALDTEIKLTSVLFEMEKHGLLADKDYCIEAQDYEIERASKAAKEIETMCGGFVDSAKFLSPHLEARGFTLPLTDKGNKQVTDEVLSSKDDALANIILEYRDAIKRATTYFSNYIGLCDRENVMHPNFRQAGTVTGRMSCNAPNLQNIPTDDRGAYPLRRAFIPRPGYVFVSIDYAQMEFRLMLEYAKQMDLIEKIFNGFDPHDATAELTGLSRKSAKTLNFGLLYGMGIAKLAKAIGVTDQEAKKFKYEYFDALPGVERFIRDARDAQASRLYTFNWTGRRYYLDDPKWAYKAANSIIQGGCADICKLAMVFLDAYLASKKSRMVLQVHDEVLFEIHYDELETILDLKQIMEAAYPAKHMPLTCSVSYSLKNFHDMIEVDANEVTGAIRKELSRESEQRPKEVEKHLGLSPE